MKLCVLVLVFVALNSINDGESAKILVISPIPAKSHQILSSAIVRILAERGHDLTFISPFAEKNPPKNGSWTDVVLTGLYEAREKAGIGNLFENEDSHPVLDLPRKNWLGQKVTEETFAHPNVQKLLKSDAKFDLIILEAFFNDGLKYFGIHYKVPIISLSTLGANAFVDTMVANPSPPSYVPNIIFGYPNHMDFWQRLKNSLYTVADSLNKHWLYLPQQNKIVQKFYPDAPHINEYIHNVSLVFLNSHVSTNSPKPYVPSMIELGGYHLNPAKKLPKDLQDYLDDAKEGVIYFSMGSNLKSSQFPLEKRTALLNVFSKLKQKVLWKFEDDQLPNQPSNVKILSWMPQQEILAHPNVKLFISHGGLLGTTETVYYGKPVLTIPIFGDQKMNAKQIEIAGFGISIPFKELTEDRISVAVQELLNNPKYFENAQSRSRIMHDRPVSAKESVVYWTEYVLRHQGAEHLRVAGLDLNWYQYLLLDVTAFCLVVVFGVLLLVRLLFKKLFGANKSAKLKKA